MDSNKSTWQSLVDAYHSAENFLGDMPIAKAIGGVIANPTPQEVGAQAVNLGKDISKGIQQFTDTAMTDPAAAGSLVSPMAGMIAYHGTPHKIVGGFKKAAIGSGEGAQAFGHGFYATDAPEIAKTYAHELGSEVIADGKTIYKNNKVVGTTGDKDVDEMLVAYVGDKNKIIKDLELEISSLEDPNSSLANFYRNQIKQIEGMDIKTNKGGRVYTLDIPEPDVMLDWDKPGTSHLSQKVVKAIEDVGVPIRQENLFTVKQDPLLDNTWAVYHNSAGNMGSGFKTKEEAEKLIPEIMKRVEPTGRRIYAGLTAKLGSPEKASEYLNSIGVKGIRYKAGQISGAKTDASNYVIFEPEDIKITAEEFLDKD